MFILFFWASALSQTYKERDHWMSRSKNLRESDFIEFHSRGLPSPWSLPCLYNILWSSIKHSSWHSGILPPSFPFSAQINFHRLVRMDSKDRYKKSELNQKSGAEIGASVGFPISQMETECEKLMLHRVKCIFFSRHARRIRLVLTRRRSPAGVKTPPNSLHRSTFPNSKGYRESS